jgi:hypothetical protein
MKSKHSRRIVPISLSQYALACGARTGVRFRSYKIAYSDVDGTPEINCK